MNVLEILLENRWILKHEDKEAYYKVKNEVSSCENIIKDKLGYNLIITPNLIKLEKIPGKVEDWMGIEDFNDQMDYALLCIVLMFMEDKGAEDQFVLSELTDYIQGNYPQEEIIDWTVYLHRRKLIKILKFFEEEGMITVNDGDVNSFADSESSEVLYESTGVSRYFMRRFLTDIMDYTSEKEFDNSEWLYVEKDRGIRRRHRVYRRLIMSPAVYSEGADDPDYAYIKNYRNMIEKDIEDYFDGQLHVHKNSTFLILGEATPFKDTFPNSKSISDIVLQLCHIIREKINSEEISINTDEIIILSENNFKELVNICRERNIKGWNKTYRELSQSKLYSEVIEFMKSFNMLKETSYVNEICLLPAAGKLTGEYPDDFNRK